MPEPSGIITMIGFPDLEEPPGWNIPPEIIPRHAEQGGRKSLLADCRKLNWPMRKSAPSRIQVYCKQEDRTMAFQLRAYHAPNFTEERFVIAPEARLTPAPSDGIAPVGCHAMSIFPEYLSTLGKS
jgi:hypothetical protein